MLIVCWLGPSNICAAIGNRNGNASAKSEKKKVTSIGAKLRIGACACVCVCDARLLMVAASPSSQAEKKDLAGPLLDVVFFFFFSLLSFLSASNRNKNQLSRILKLQNDEGTIVRHFVYFFSHSFLSPCHEIATRLGIRRVSQLPIYVFDSINHLSPAERDQEAQENEKTNKTISILVAQIIVVLIVHVHAKILLHVEEFLVETNPP